MLTIAMFDGPVVKAIFFPSGDKDGPESPFGWVTTAVASVPSAFMVQISNVRTNAILLLGGGAVDDAGRHVGALSDVALLLILVWTVPFTCITKSCRWPETLRSKAMR